MRNSAAPKVLLLDNVLCDKIEAHKNGLAHYAFSIIMYNSRNEILLQKRAFFKYHSGGLWSNACCGHPISNTDMDDIKHQAIRQIFEELGTEVHDIRYAFTFSYQGNCGNLKENEVDYVFFCKCESKITPNFDEVADYKWVSLWTLDSEMKKNPSAFTLWFREMYTKYNHQLLGFLSL
ncbi:isopentenyl-diphosphate Delta-isomerase [Hoylesella shahii]